MCQDLEIVGGKSVPQISLKKFIDMANAETKAAKEKGTKTKKDKITGEIIPGAKPEGDAVEMYGAPITPYTKRNADTDSQGDSGVPKFDE